MLKTGTNRKGKSNQIKKRVRFSRTIVAAKKPLFKQKLESAPAKRMIDKPMAKIKAK
jgi:hypothetical protein